MRKVLTGLVLGMGIIGFGFSASSDQTPPTTTVSSASASLDGSTWPVKLTPDAAAAKAGEKAFDDELAFNNGQVTMSACVKSGFAPSSYSASVAGTTWSFDTKQASADQGETNWTGIISGDSIKGTMIWTKKDGSTLHYDYEGKKAAESSKS